MRKKLLMLLCIICLLFSTVTVSVFAANSDAQKPARTVKTIIKLQIKAEQATPAPPVGVALKNVGFSDEQISKFCDDFNKKSHVYAGFIVPTRITVYTDLSYAFQLTTPPASVRFTKGGDLGPKPITPEDARSRFGQDINGVNN